jgi:hypothetical protein
VAVEGIVRRIEVEDDLLGRGAVRVEEELDEQALDRCRVVADLMVARGLAHGRMLEPVERALAGQGRTVRPACLELPGKRRHDRVVATPVVVEHVLIPQRQAKDPLADHGRDLVLDLIRRAPILKTAGEAFDEPDRLVRGAQQQRAGVRGHRPAVECRHHAAPLNHSKVELRCATVCRHRGALLHRVKSLLQKSYRRYRAPTHLSSVRNTG